MRIDRARVQRGALVLGSIPSPPHNGLLLLSTVLPRPLEHLFEDFDLRQVLDVKRGRGLSRLLAQLLGQAHVRFLLHVELRLELVELRFPHEGLEQRVAFREERKRLEEKWLEEKRLEKRRVWR